MWLMNCITQGLAAAPSAVRGSINKSDGESSGVVASTEYKNINQCAPYGIESVAPVGQRAVVLPLDFGDVALGVVSSTSGLEQGEIRIRSMGGAEILLKNSGEVIINGTVIGSV